MKIIKCYEDYTKLCKALKSKQYDLTMISNIKGQISIEKIIPFKIKNTTFVLTAGEKFVELYEPQNDWKRTRIFENTSSSLDVTYAVLNGKPKIRVKKREKNKGQTRKMIDTSCFFFV